MRRKVKEAKDGLPPNRKAKPMTNLEQLMADMLDDLEIKWEREHPIKYMRGHWRWYDFYLIDYEILIEVDGAYWHGKVGKQSYVTMMQKKNDYTKNFLAKLRGYELIRVEEKKLLGDYDGVKESISVRVGKNNL